MKSKVVWICVLFDIALLAGLFLYFTWETKEELIKAEIMKANYCEVVSDCQLVGISQCPFGCYIHVNRNEAPRIEALLKGYESKCAYGCVEMKGVECVANTCQVLP